MHVFSCGRACRGVFEGRALCRSDIAGEDAAEDVADLGADSRPMDHSKVASLRVVKFRVTSPRAGSHCTTSISARKAGMVATVTTAVDSRA